jgi:hypothetical protein
MDPISRLQSIVAPEFECGFFTCCGKLHGGKPQPTTEIRKPGTKQQELAVYDSTTATVCGVGIFFMINQSFEIIVDDLVPDGNDCILCPFLCRSSFLLISQCLVGQAPHTNAG